MAIHLLLIQNFVFKEADFAKSFSGGRLIGSKGPDSTTLQMFEPDRDKMNYVVSSLKFQVNIVVTKQKNVQFN